MPDEFYSTDAPAPKSSLKKGHRFQNEPGNTRGHRNINGRHNKDKRRDEAFARQDAWRKLSPKEQLARLPHDGAVKQRARINAVLASRSAKAAETQKNEKRVEAKAQQLVADGKAVSLAEAKRTVKQKKDKAA